MNYRSRSAFKLIEINEKYRLLRPGLTVLDVGSAPGGWSQVISDEVRSDKKNPSCVAVDILPMDPVSGVKFVHGDMNKQEVHDRILEVNKYQKFDLICSDICPEFTGVKFTDHVNLIKLNEITIDFGSKVLKRNGNFVIKTFEGTLQKKFQEGFRKYFKNIHRFKPSSSRSESSELYLVCLGYLENEELKKEAEAISKMSKEEYLEQEKNNALKEYRLAKLNEMTLLEDLDKMKEEIIKKFKIDPETVKVDPKEEEELKKIIEEENEKLHNELYGSAYKPIKAKTFNEFIKDFEKKMKENDDKIRKTMEKEKFDPVEIEEFFQEDVNQQHMKDIANEKMKEAEYIYDKIDQLKTKIEEEDIESVLRDDDEPNKILSKYKRWENILKDVEERHKDSMNDQSEGYTERDKMYHDLGTEEHRYFAGISNLRKKLRKSIDIKSHNIKENEDIFWQKRNRGDK